MLKNNIEETRQASISEMLHQQRAIISDLSSEVYRFEEVLTKVTKEFNFKQVENVTDLGGESKEPYPGVYEIISENSRLLSNCFNRFNNLVTSLNNIL